MPPAPVRHKRAEIRKKEVATIPALRAALEAAGVEFIDENGGGLWRAAAEGRVKTGMMVI